MSKCLNIYSVKSLVLVELHQYFCLKFPLSKPAPNACYCYCRVTSAIVFRSWDSLHHFTSFAFVSWQLSWNGQAELLCLSIDFQWTFDFQYTCSPTRLLCLLIGLKRLHLWDQDCPCLVLYIFLLSLFSWPTSNGFLLEMQKAADVFVLFFPRRC